MPRCTHHRTALPLLVTMLLAASATRGVVRATPHTTPRWFDPQPLCGAELGDDLVIGLCTADGHASAEPVRVRRAIGRPLCWHSVGHDEIATVPGVGASLAERLLEARDAGARPTLDALDAVRGVGPTLAARVASAVTVDCPGVATPARSAGH